MSPSQAQAQSSVSGRPSRVARIALYHGLITLAAVVIGVLGATTGLLPPLSGFLLFGAAMVLGSVLRRWLLPDLAVAASSLTRAKPGRDRRRPRRSFPAP